MIVWRIVLVWVVMSAAGSAIAYFTYSEQSNKWFGVVWTMAIFTFVLPILFLITVLYYRFFKMNRAKLYELSPTEENRQA